MTAAVEGMNEVHEEKEDEMTEERNQREDKSVSGESEDQLAPENLVTRRHFLKTAGGVSIAFVAAACGPAATPTALPEDTAAPPPTTAPGITPEATAGPTSEGTGWMIYGANVEGEGIDPAVGYTLWSRWVDDNVYDALLRYKGDPPELVPHLAKSWEVSDDGLEWTFYLEEGVTFHDGTDLKASEVVYTIERMLAMGDAPSYLWEKVDPDQCEAVDDYTVKVVLKEPFGPFLFTMPWLYIVNEKLLRAEEVDGDWGAAYLRDHDAGSGPFMITNFDPAVTIDMPYYEDYWKGWTGKRIDGWSYQIHREMGTLKRLLESREIHITDRLSEDDFLVVADYPGVVVEENVSQAPFAVKMNNVRWPTSDLNFRKAVTYAMDYDGVINGLLQGHATPLTSPVPPGMAGQLDLLDSKQDMDLARQHLELSGFDVNEMTISFGYVAGDPFQRDVGLIVQETLRELGISVEVEGYTPALSVGQWESADVMNHFWPIWAASDYPDPENLLYPQYHSRNHGSWYSCSFYKSERYDELLDQARSLPKVEDRVPIYEELQRILVEDAVDVWLFAWQVRIAMLDCFKGYEWQPAGMWSTYLRPVWLEEC